MIKHVNIFCSMFWMDKANNSMISTVPVMVTNKENAPSTDPAGRRYASVWWIVIGAFSEHTWSDCIFIGTLNTSCVCMYDFNWSYSFFSHFIHWLHPESMCFPMFSHQFWAMKCEAFAGGPAASHRRRCRSSWIKMNGWRAKTCGISDGWPTSFQEWIRQQCRVMARNFSYK